MNMYKGKCVFHLFHQHAFPQHRMLWYLQSSQPWESKNERLALRKVFLRPEETLQVDEEKPTPKSGLTRKFWWTLAHVSLFRRIRQVQPTNGCTCRYVLAILLLISHDFVLRMVRMVRMVRCYLQWKTARASSPSCWRMANMDVFWGVTEVDVLSHTWDWIIPLFFRRTFFVPDITQHHAGHAGYAGYSGPAIFASTSTVPIFSLFLMSVPKRA